MPPKKTKPTIKPKSIVQTPRPLRPAVVLKHKDKRANIPTEELRDFVADEEKQPKTVPLPARPVARPAIGVEGQGRAGRQALAVPAVPVYIQEKIQPQAIIENVRAEAQKGRARANGTCSPISTASRSRTD